jgi:hypothetical protein
MVGEIKIGGFMFPLLLTIPAKYSLEQGSITSPRSVTNDKVEGVALRGLSPQETRNKIANEKALLPTAIFTSLVNKEGFPEKYIVPLKPEPRKEVSFPPTKKTVKASGAVKNDSSLVVKGAVAVGAAAVTDIVIPKVCDSLFSNVGYWMCNVDDIDCKQQWLDSVSNWTCKKTSQVAFGLALTSLLKPKDPNKK